ncbi:hypothetical protein [Dolosigranulum pigrum]|uniref:hypothetical protein n=1 Tax=Dolosigranulum pigrum TaxID=29394 RepID=UPI0021B13A4C|nr:hypothetical protein [Dolosigranulum pigrum]
MLNPVLISVVTVIILSLLRLNVLLSLIIGGLVGGLLAGMSVEGVMTILVEGMAEMLRQLWIIFYSGRWPLLLANREWLPY